MKRRSQVLSVLEGAWLEIERLFLKIVSRILPATIGDPQTCEHEWYVEEVDNQTVALLLTCYHCQSNGSVKDPNEKEWSDAYHAPSTPYRWSDDLRVSYDKYWGPAGPLPDGWKTLSDSEFEKLTDELNRELPKSHILYGLDLMPVARREDVDDFLFRLKTDPDDHYIVHLTWNIETDPNYPWVTRFASFADFSVNWSKHYK